MVYVELMRNFNVADSNKVMAVRLISVPLGPKTFHFKFLDVMCVVFMKKFHLADSNKLMAVRLISAF